MFLALVDQLAVDVTMDGALPDVQFRPGDLGIHLLIMTSHKLDQSTFLVPVVTITRLSVGSIIYLALSPLVVIVDVDDEKVPCTACRPLICVSLRFGVFSFVSCPPPLSLPPRTHSWTRSSPMFCLFCKSLNTINKYLCIICRHGRDPFFTWRLLRC